MHASETFYYFLKTYRSCAFFGSTGTVMHYDFLVDPMQLVGSFITVCNRLDNSSKIYNATVMFPFFPGQLRITNDDSQTTMSLIMKLTQRTQEGQNEERTRRQLSHLLLVLIC